MRINPSICFAVGLLLAAEARAIDTVSTGARTNPDAGRINLDLTASLRHRQEQEELLGEGRRRRLKIARYHLARDGFGYDLAEDPKAFEETKDILRSCLFKLARRRLEESPPVERFLDRFEAVHDATTARTRGLGLRISPQLGLGSHAYFGANLSLRSRPDELRSNFTLGLRQNLGTDASTVFVEYKEKNRYVRLEQLLDHEERGDETSVLIRLRF